MKFNRNKGITLIALVVTIIVLLILAGITLSLALNNNGIFQRSKNAAAKYSEAEQAERAELERIGQEMDEVMGIFPPLEIPSELKIGDKIKYEPSGEFHWNAELATSYEKDSENYNAIDKQLATGNNAKGEENEGKEDMSITDWHVFDIDRENGKVVIVPAKLTAGISEDYSSMWGMVTLNGAQGYNNGVKLLNDACLNLYGNTKKGINARSIKIEDLEKIMEEENVKNDEGNTLLSVAKNSTFTKYGNRYESTGYERDETGSYNKYKSFPSIYAKEKNSIVNNILSTKGLGLSEQNSYIGRSESVQAGGKNYTSESGYTTPDTIRPAQTYYAMDYDTLGKALGNKKNLILPEDEKSTYLIASRCVNLEAPGNNCCFFEISSIMSGILFSYILAPSWGMPEQDGSELGGLFPIVTLTSGELNKNSEEGYDFTSI